MKQTALFLSVVGILLVIVFGCSEFMTSKESSPPTPSGVGPQQVLAGRAPGDLIQNVDLPVPGTGVSVAVDCDGNVYYTVADDTNLYVMDKDGNLLDTRPIVDSDTGAGLLIDEFAWDESRGVLWAQLHDSNPVDVYHIDPATAVATFQWTSATNSVGTYRDGIAYDGTDDTIWITGDVSDTIEHYMSDGTFIGSITPKDANGDVLGAISGVIVGVGDLLYLGQNGRVMIVQVEKSDGDFIAQFASPGGARDEGLECDPVNFADQGKLALWSREFNPPGFISVIEIEEGTCTCGGEPPEIAVPLDIKPTSCPNPLNTKSRGVLPAAILGTEDLDVTQIDPESLMLEGVPALRWSLEDVATPYEPYLGKTDCHADCNELGADGFVDLTLKFDKMSILEALGDVPNRDCLVLTLTGNLREEFGGTPIIGEDVVLILSGGGGRSRDGVIRD